jgi:hypothetical protein
MTELLEEQEQSEQAPQHTVADHPEFDDPAFMKELVHGLLHLVEQLGQRVHDLEHRIEALDG